MMRTRTPCAASGSGTAVALPRVALVAAVNDEAVLENNLLRSPVLARGALPLGVYRGCRSASEAYNRGLDDVGRDADIVVFVHQDVYLPACWEADLARALSWLDTHDPDWGVIGCSGVDADGKWVGHCWSSGLGRRDGGRFETPQPAMCIDELMIVLRRGSGLRFDEGLPGYHLYAGDIVLMAREQGFSSYVADIPVVHNSRPVRKLDASYGRAHRYMRRKWRHALPLPTLIVPLTGSPLPLARKRLRMWLTRNKRLARAADPTRNPVEIARSIGLE